MAENKEKQYTIAIMTGDTQSDYSEELMRGFYTAAHEENVNLVLLMGPQIPTYCTDIVTSSLTGNYRYQFNSIYQYAHFIKPDAAVISYGSSSAFNAEQDKQTFLGQFSDIPYLVIEDKSLDDEVPYLIIDNYTGMKACVEHLLEEHGYRKIAFLGGPKNNYDAGERLRAYCDTMQEHNITVTDTMIVHGDYTDRVDEQVIYLLNNNPGLEAIVCANDGMAKSCYRVCASRNLFVGRDIAVTGFDDISSASTMNPPLTSVSQSSFHMSYAALKSAVALCRGEKVVSRSLRTVLKKRCSCGCSPMGILTTDLIPEGEMEIFLQKVIEEVAPYLFSSVAYEKERQYLTRALTDYIFYIYDIFFRETEEKFSMEHLLGILRDMATNPSLPSTLLVEKITQILKVIQANAKTEEVREKIATIISSTQQYIHAWNIEKLEREIYISNRKSWFVPTFTRDLAMRSSQVIFRRVMEELRKMAIKSAYFFLFDKPIIHEPGQPLHFPEEMCLTAYFDAENLVYFSETEQLKFTTRNGFMSFISKDAPVCLTPVILFSEQKQYGIMICEVDHADIAFLQICSVQLGTLFHFIELTQLEKQAQAELQNSLRVIEEQNKILSFISDYDELSKLLNRRGFIERAIALYEQNEGRHAYLIFGDLDHLKEINDVFGHVEGDFAIQNIAGRFQTVLPQDAVSGRIGGDEFVSLVFTDEAGFKSRILKDFAETGSRFNESGEKPYYIDVSLGIYEFVCDPQTAFAEMLNNSDKLLYEAKKNRRGSVKKEVGR